MIDLTQDSIKLSKAFPKFCDSFFIEGDVIIPDAKPDVESILCLDALPNIENSIVNSGQLTISGNCEFNILYVSEKLPNEIIRISTSIPFKNSFAIGNITPESYVELNILPAKVSSLILNGRKISVSAELETCVNISECEEIAYVNGIGNSDTIKQQKSTKTIPVFVSNSKDSTTIHDTAMLESNQPTIKDILRYDSSINNLETTISDEKVLLKAELTVKIYYIAEDSSEIYTFNASLPFSSFIDAKDISNADICNALSKVKYLSIKPIPDSDDLLRIIEFTANIESILKIFRNTELEIIEDVYSTESDLIPQRENISYEVMSPQISEEITMRGAISIPEDENVKILTSVGKIKSINLREENNNSILSGIIDVTAIYGVPSNGKISSVSLDMPIEHILSKNIQSLSDVKIDSIDVTNSGIEKYDVKISLTANGYENKKDEISVLRDIVELEEPVNKAQGITVYFIKPGDTLWKIAKKFHTTIEHITEINNLENPDMINAGSLLII